METIDKFWDGVEDIVSEMGYYMSIDQERLDYVLSFARSLSKYDPNKRKASPDKTGFTYSIS
jgi:hypothetical protein